MANCVACLRCGHKFAPQTDVRKKNNPCPRCGSTEQLELVGVPAPEPEPVPPQPAPRPARPEPSGGAAIAAGEAVQPAGDVSAGQNVRREQDEALYDSAGGRDAPDGGDLPRDDGLTGAPGHLIVTLAAILLMLAAGGYLAWRHFRAGEEVASAQPRGEEAGPAAVEPAASPSQPTTTEPAEPTPAPPVEPDLPPAVPEPAEGVAPQGPFADTPVQPGQATGMPAEPPSVSPEPAMTEPPSLPPAEPPQSSEPSEPAGAAPGPAQEPAGGSTPDVTPAEPSPPAAKVARSLEAAQAAIVKFELPLGIGDLTEYGTGFLIDSRGWVATNNHVAANITTDSRVKMARGEELKVEGVLASAPSRDLALVKLADPPDNLTVLDIQYDGSPKLGSSVYAFGHPYQADFSLSNGVVGRVLTTAEMLAAARELVVKRIGAPEDMVWIQHDAKISPGNSGGPLIDDEGRVLGVNTFVNVKAEFGYASHVRYLRELAAGATGEVKPAPPPREFVQTRISEDRIKELFAIADADGFKWKPRTLEQYDHLAELAKQLTLAKHALAVAGSRPGAPPAVLQGVARLADQAFAAIQKAPWGPEQLGAFNNFAADQADQAGQGVVFCGVVWATNPQRPGDVVMALHGTQKPLFVRLASPAADLEPGSRWLVFGFVTPGTIAVNVKGESEPRRAHLLLVHYLTRVP